MSLKMPKFSWSLLSVPALLAFWMLVVLVVDLGRSTQTDFEKCRYSYNVQTKDAASSLTFMSGSIICDQKYSTPRTVASPLEVFDALLKWVTPNVETEQVEVKSTAPSAKFDGGEIKLLALTEQITKIVLKPQVFERVVYTTPKAGSNEERSCVTYYEDAKGNRVNDKGFFLDPSKNEDGSFAKLDSNAAKIKVDGKDRVTILAPVPLKIEYNLKFSSCSAAVTQSWSTLGSLGPHLWQSFQEVFVGFLIACIVAIILGFWAGFNKGFREFITPLNGILMSIPAIAWAPMMIVIFTSKFTAIVVVVYIAAVSPMIVAIMEGILTITGQEVRAARALGCKPAQLFRYIYIPASLPFITAGMRIGFSQAWRALVAAEIIGGVGMGLGQVVDLSAQVGDAESMMLAIAMIGFLSYLFERLIFRRMEKHYEVWRIR